MAEVRAWLKNARDLEEVALRLHMYTNGCIKERVPSPLFADIKDLMLRLRSGILDHCVCLSLKVDSAVPALRNPLCRTCEQTCTPCRM